MKRLGKLLLLAVLSVSSLSASTLEKVFGLKEQAFAEVTSKKLNKYKISDNFLFGITMSKVDSYDGYSGSFIEGRFKNANLKNWVFIEKSWMYNKGENQLTFSDENGINLIISTYYSGDKLCAGDQCINGVKGDKNIEIKVLFVNSQFSCYINGTKLYSSKKRFGSLKSFTQSFHSNDKLIDINLSEIK